MKGGESIEREKVKREKESKKKYDHECTKSSSHVCNTGARACK